MAGFVGSATTSQERDVGDCGAPGDGLKESCLLEAQLPLQHQGWPYKLPPSRSSGDPKKMYCSSSSSPGATASPLPTAGPSPTPGRFTPEGQTEPAREREAKMLRSLATSTGVPSISLPSSKVHEGGTSPSPCDAGAKDPMEQAPLTKGTQGLGGAVGH